MTERFAKKKIVPWKIRELKPHPRQGVFRPHTAVEINEFAASLDEQGLINPVEITPDGIIICGHGRVAAAKQLGWKKIACWVRHDLVEQGEEAVFRRLVEDNLHRRQLTKLGLGRAFLALKEEEYDRWLAKDQEQARGDFRDYLGELLGCDGTTAERWAKLAVLPVEYDQFIESGLLSQQDAKRIARTPVSESWESIAQTMLKVMQSDIPRKDKKTDIKKVVESQLGHRKKSTTSARVSWSTGLCRVLDKALQDLPDNVLRAVQSCKGRSGVPRTSGSNTSSVSNTKRATFPRITLDEKDKRTLEMSRALIGAVLSAADADGND